MNRLRALFGRRALDQTAEAEMRSHVEMEIEAGLSRGLTRSEAERAARLRLGSIDASLDEVRDQRYFGWLTGVAMDFRQAWSALRRRPSYLFVAGGALAAAVAVNTLVFTVLYSVLLSPLPYPEPDRLVRVFENSAPTPKFPLSIYHYQENQRSAQLLEAQALYTQGDMQLMHEERAEPVTAVAITEQFFPLLGGLPVRGRNFRSDEMVRSARVVILSNSFWTSRLHADPDIVGKTLRLDREPWTVIGVAPPGFEHVGGQYRSPLQGDTVAIWRPLPEDIPNPNSLRGSHYTNAIARLKPGVSADAAQQELNRILNGLAHQYPDNYAGKWVSLAPLNLEVAGKSRGTVLVISSAGGMVLLLATINIAGLSIARALARRRELAVRAALGGSRWRLLRTVLSENLVLAAIAGLVGLAAAALLLPLLRAILPPDFPRLHEVVFRWPSALFAIAAATLTSLTAGLVGSLRHTTADPAETLHEDSRSVSGSRQATRLRSLLVVLQVGLASILLFGSVLLFRSSSALSGRDHGFDPSHTLTFGLTFPSKAYNDGQLAAFYAEAGRRLREVPGVQSAGFATSVPWTGYDDNTVFDVPGYVPRQGEAVEARYQAASAGFIEALKMRLVKGRSINAADRKEASTVVVINEALARSYFPDRDALGRFVNIWGANREVVGIVADIRDYPADAEAKPAFWMAMEQVPFPRIVAAVRTNEDPSDVLPAVRSVLSSIDPELPMVNVRFLSTIANDALAERRFTLLWSETFAGMAIGLAALGIYALLAYSVQQRHREIGIRLALGASRGQILRKVFAAGLFLTASGTTGGLLLAPAAGKALGGLLFGVSSTDLMAMLLAPTIVLAIAIIACLAPAYVAVQTQPANALREQ